MKRSLVIIFSLIIMPVTVWAYTSPGSPTGYVNDFAGILNEQDKQTIETKLQSLKQTTGAEVSVATIKSLGDETVEGYSIKLAEEWGIGNKEMDNGLLILIAPNEQQTRIEVGYGLEGTITDIQSGIIIRNVMIPAFKVNNYSKGINDAVDAITAVVTKSPEAEKYLQDNSSNSTSSNTDGYGPLIIFIIIALNIVMSVMARILGKTKSWWLGGVIGAVIGILIGLISWSIIIGVFSTLILSLIGLIFDFIVSKHPPKGGGHYGGYGGFFSGGGHSGFGGGGGFGGFGGGSFGGGGASGRW